MKKFILFTIFFSVHYLFGQCINNVANIYSFIYNNQTFEIVKENKTWSEAASCAFERGGKLAEINDINEQNALFDQLINQANINLNSTVSSDGGEASYIWIGGNDITTEGVWVWDGANTGNGTQFWQGDFNGNAVNGLYNNWGNEPDNWTFSQHALGLALTEWPRGINDNPIGIAGEWNDLVPNNMLYYIIEYNDILDLKTLEAKNKFRIYPNVVVDKLHLEVNTDFHSSSKYHIINILGQPIMEENLDQKKEIECSTLPKGSYFLKIDLINENYIFKIMKE